MPRSIVQFHSNGDDFARRLKAKAAEVERAGRRGLTIIGEDFVKRQKKEFAPFRMGAIHTGLGQGPLGYPQIMARGGKLRSSVGAYVSGDKLQNMKVRLRVGSKAAPYAAIQEFGAKPRPKTAEYMRIPLPGALTPTGRKIKSKARPVRTGTTKKGKPIYTSGFGRLVPITTKKGNVVIVAKRKGRNGKETYGYKEPLFVLKKKVEVPPRLNARKILYGVLRRRMPRLRGAIFQILAPSEMLKGGK